MQGMRKKSRGMTKEMSRFHTGRWLHDGRACREKQVWWGKMTGSVWEY